VQNGLDAMGLLSFQSEIYVFGSLIEGERWRGRRTVWLIDHYLLKVYYSNKSIYFW
jgi:hypothetical protein